mmetsp:Transcript_27039/g.59365  ORF Transcript_27039/g.59365 Transcript_27039/m.59365 type:complete len:441 (+) Transcript_27039:69-1391(+)
MALLAHHTQPCQRQLPTKRSRHVSSLGVAASRSAASVMVKEGARLAPLGRQALFSATCLGLAAARRSSCENTPWSNRVSRRMPERHNRYRLVWAAAADAGSEDQERQTLPTEPKWRWRPNKAVVRWLTGLVLGLGICGPATFYGGWPFCIMVSIAVLFVVLEYTNLLKYILTPPLSPSIRWFTLFISVLTVLAAQVGILTGIFESAAVGLLVMLIALQGNTRAADGGPPIRFSHISSQVFGIFYCGYLPAFWVRLRDIAVPLSTTPSAALRTLCRLLGWKIELTVGAFATASCALCIIAADTCAYMGGKRWGKRPLILISPNKTWEGMFFGLAGSIGMALLCDAGWGFPAKPPLAVLVGVLIFSVGLLGDLTVSAMKRDAGLKDAGALFPGHGGILDRFDSFIFSAPAAYFCWFTYLMAVGNPVARFRKSLLKMSLFAGV